MGSNIGGALSNIGSSIGNGVKALGNTLPTIGLGLLAANAGGNTPGNATPSGTQTTNPGSVLPSLLNPDKAGVSSIGSPKISYRPIPRIGKMASVGDILTRAAQYRLINSALNSVAGAPPATTATAGGAAPPAVSSSQEVDPKAIEVVSKYPEIAKMLKDDDTKAYLESLLKEK